MYPSERVFTQLTSSDTEAAPGVITYNPISIIYASTVDADAACTFGFAFKTDPYLNATAIIPAGCIHDYGVTRCQSIIITGAVSGINALPKLSYSIKLKDLLPDTIFNVDRDIYLSSSIILKLNWNSRGNIAFVMDKYGALGAETAEDLVLTNITLNHYIQANPEIVSLKIAESQKQIQIIIPELNENSLSLTGTTQQTITKIISNTNNSRLYKTYSGLFLADATNKINNSQNHGIVTLDGGARANCIKYTNIGQVHSVQEENKLHKCSVLFYNNILKVFD